jgi:hypothetical protein
MIHDDKRYIEFQKYGMLKKTIIEEDIFERFDHSLSEVMLIAKLKDFEIRCYNDHNTPIMDKTKSFVMFSFVKNDNILLNLTLNVIKKSVFKGISIICIKTNRVSQENFNLFYQEYQSQNLYENYKRFGNGLTFQTIDDIEKALKIMETILLHLK